MPTDSDPRVSAVSFKVYTRDGAWGTQINDLTVRVSGSGQGSPGVIGNFPAGAFDEADSTEITKAAGDLLSLVEKAVRRAMGYRVEPSDVPATEETEL